jgi:6-phosphogluconolactonase
MEPREAGATTHVEVFPAPDALMRAAADRLVDRAGGAVEAHGRFAVALSGGSTPRALYELLATEAYAARIDWPSVHVFWSDERCVPPGDPASNYRMARETLLDRVPVPAGNVHRIRGEDEPATAATAYESELRGFFGANGRFDLVLLGMGEDGHTASLFPRTAAIRETRNQVVAHHAAAVSAWRITLTPVVINAASEVWFLVSGGNKAATLRTAVEGPYDPDAIPAQAIAPRDGELLWLVDAAAAAKLERSRAGR